LTNTKILIELYGGDEYLLYKGHGDLADGESYNQKFWLMPHEELLKSIAQFGFVLTLLFCSVSGRTWNKYTCYETIEYVLPVLFCTLFLWVRFTVMPSIEMILALYAVSLKKIKYNSPKLL
jgi:hypothetical protein